MKCSCLLLEEVNLGTVRENIHRLVFLVDQTNQMESKDNRTIKVRFFLVGFGFISHI